MWIHYIPAKEWRTLSAAMSTRERSLPEECTARANIDGQPGWNTTATSETMSSGELGFIGSSGLTKLFEESVAALDESRMKVLHNSLVDLM